MPYLDFKALKAAVPIVAVANWLRIDLTKSGDTYRGSCPFCESRDDRVFVVTPAERSFCCHADCEPKPGQKKYGSDIIELVARAHQVSPREAAQEIAKHFNYGNSGNSEHSHRDNRSTTTKATAAPSSDALQPLTHLSTDHEAIEALGLTPAICNAIGIGYTGKGLMRARVAFPLRLPDGTLVGYMGLATTHDQKPLILFPKNLEEKCALPAPQTESEAKSAEIIDIRKLYRA